MSILAVLILLPAILYGLMHTDFVQAFFLRKITAYLSDELQVEISAEAIDFSPFRSVILQNVSMKDRENRQLLSVNRVIVQLEKLSIRNRQMVFGEIDFDNALLNIYKDENHHNFRFLIDYFSEKDTIASKVKPDPWSFKLNSIRVGNTALNYQESNAYLNISGFNPAAFSLSDLNMAMRDILITDGAIFFELDYLRYKDSHGYGINHLSGTFNLYHDSSQAQNVLLRTDNSEIQFDLSATFNRTYPAGFSFDDVAFELNIAPSLIRLSELAHYYQPLYGLNEDLSIRGSLIGSGTEVIGQKVKLAVGTGSIFQGDFQIADFSDIHSSDFYLKVERLSSSFNIIKDLELPYAWGVGSLALPDYLFELGDISYSGLLTGNLDDFISAGMFTTGAGNLKTNINLKKHENHDHYHYDGLIRSEDFDLGSLFDNSDLLGKVNLKAEIKGQGFTLDNLNLFLDGNITGIDILDHRYQNVQMNGTFTDRKFSGLVLVDDDNLFLDFRGEVDFSDYVPLFDFYASVYEANLGALNIFERDAQTVSMLTTNMSIRARARTLDDLEGTISLKDLSYKEIKIPDGSQSADTLMLATDSIYISNTLWPGNRKHFRVRSDFVDADIHGKIQFDEIRNTFNSFIHNYIPVWYNGLETTPKEAQHGQDIEYSIRIKDTDALSRFFFPDIKISAGSWVNGTYSSDNHDLELEAYAGRFDFAGRTFIEWYINGGNAGDQIMLSARSQKLMLSDSLHLDNFDIHTVAADGTLCFEAYWNNKDTWRKNSGHLVGIGKILSPRSFEFIFLPSHTYIDGDLWQLNIDNRIFIDAGRIEIHQLMVYNNEQFIRADGVLSADIRDRMTLSFANFDVAYSEYLMNTKNFEFGGIMNGYISFTGFYQQPSVLTELFIKDFSFNHDHLGDLAVESLWDSEKQAFKVDAAITYHGNVGSNQPLVVSGYIDPGSADKNFDLDIDITNKKMSVWGRYMQGFAENFRGLASGKMRLDGAFSSPELTGNVRLLRTGLHIPYLNTSYSFAHNVEIGKDYFKFDDLVLNDTLGNTATLTGRLMHNGFKDFSIDFLLRPEQLVIFNTTVAQQDYYYGTAFLTGLAHIHGPVNNITMDVSARTNRGTTVILPLDYRGEIRESHFISFVNRDTGQDAPIFIPPEMRGSMALNFDLEVTPDAEVQLLFDARFGDIIRGRGTGNLKLEITPEGLFNIYGDYVIESGEYVFMLQNIINKRFRIEQGSTIRWTGDINDADVELSAVYQVRTRLYDLIAGEFNDPATAEVYRRRIPIETVLMLEDKLFNPAISFDIRVPGGDENTRELIERIITTDQEMNRQVFSLLVLNRFLPTTFDQYNTALGYGVGSTSSELLSNQLSNWLSQISSDFDIGINYRPGDELSSQELELALSTQLFDDRVLIDGNFGVAGNETASGQSTEGASQIIGDVNIEVKLTPEGKLRVKAFNRSNTFDILNTNAPYTQGIGIFYRKEFDEFVDIFRRQRQPGEVPDEAGRQTDPESAGATLRVGSEVDHELQ